MTPLFLTITSTGQLYVSDDVAYVPPGTIIQTFRIGGLSSNQLLCTLTGSGNASTGALAVTPAKRSGKAEGNEIQ
jgi:hypothetical protein